MRASLLLCIALFAALIYADCPKISCNSIGATCDGSQKLCVPLDTTYCDQDTYKCVSKIRQGSACTLSYSSLADPCLSGSSCNGTLCVSDLAPPTTLAQLGQSCTDISCDSRWKCVSGKCVGRNLGESCGTTFCTPPLYCAADTQQCTALGGEGASCSFSGSGYSATVSASATCNFGLVCARTSSSATVGTCQPVASIRNSFNCDATIQCLDRSYCTGSTCQTPYTQPSSSKPCDSVGSSCASGETCVCNGITGNTVCQASTPSYSMPNPSGTAAAVQAAGTCAAANCPTLSQGCLLSVGAGCSDYENACMYAKCSTQWCAVKSLLLSANAQENALLPACARPQLPSQCSKKNSAVGVVVPFALITGLAILSL